MYGAQTFDFDHDDANDRRAEMERQGSDPTLSQALYDGDEAGVPMDSGVPMDGQFADMGHDENGAGKRCGCCAKCRGICCDSAGMGKCRIFFIVLTVLLLGLTATYATLSIRDNRKRKEVAGTPPTTTLPPSPDIAVQEKENNDTSGAATTPPLQDLTAQGEEDEPVSRMQAIADKIVVVTTKDVLMDNNSPQNKALHWIVTEDAREVDPEHPNLMQRYTLAVLYFATNGPLWKDTSEDEDPLKPTLMNWLTPLHECEWDRVSCEGEVAARRLMDASTNIHNWNHVHKRPSLRSTNTNTSPNTKKRNLFDEYDDNDFEDYFDKFDGTESEKDTSSSQSSPSAMKGGEAVVDVSLIRDKTDDIQDRTQADLGGLLEGSVTSLELHALNLDGKIPEELGSLELLEILDMSSNQLEGPLPITMGSTSKLRILMLNDNNLNGTMPSSMGDLENLEELRFDNNNLSGPVPEELCTLKLPGLLTSVESNPSLTCTCCSTDIKTEEQMVGSENGTEVMDGIASGLVTDDPLVYVEDATEAMDVGNTEEVTEGGGTVIAVMTSEEPALPPPTFSEDSIPQLDLNTTGGEMEGFSNVMAVRSPGDDSFGSSVALSGDGNVMAVGAQGFVQVFQVATDSEGNAEWQSLGSDIVGEADDDDFGFSVALSLDGKHVAVGAIGSQVNGENSGHVRVFEFVEERWEPLGNTLAGTVQGAKFGSSVALSKEGTVLAVGAPAGDEGSGAVYVYEIIDSIWEPKGAALEGIGGTEVGSGFGSSVDISEDGTVVAAGAPKAGSGAGYVALYEFAEDAWKDVISMKGTTEQEVHFGASVALSASGEYVAVGAPLHDQGRGQAVVYKRNEIGANKMPAFPIEGATQGDNAGRSVSLSESDGELTLVIGAPGSDATDGTGLAMVYRFSDSSTDEETTLVQVGQDLNGEEPSDRNGFSVSVSPNGLVVAVGAPSLENGGYVQSYQLS